MVLAVLLPSGCGGETGSTQADDTGTAEQPAARPRTVEPEEHPYPNPNPPAKPVRLVFVHHSVGEDWLDDAKGGLGRALEQNNYFVSDTNYGWGPADKDVGDERIGDHTDIGHWYNWFAGPNRDIYLKALYVEDGRSTSASYARIKEEPEGENEIIMIKSCFTNSPLGGSPDDPPATGQNLLRGQGSGEEVHTVQNAKGIYNDLLKYFETRQDKLFIIVTAPPNVEGEASPGQAANARALNRWLVDQWLEGYPYRNVAVFDFYNVLTSNGGSPEKNDAGGASGNHHRYNREMDAIEYVTSQGGNFAAYGSDGDSHPTDAGLMKATDEFVELLNIGYHAWKGE